MNPYYYGTAQNIGVPYGTGYGYQQPMPSPNYVNNNYQSQQIQNQNNASTPMQQVFLPLTNVNTIEEVNRFIVPINQSVYFRINNSNKIYLKSTDIKGVSSIEEFDLVKSDSLKPTSNDVATNLNYATKEDLVAIANDLMQLRDFIRSEIKSLSNQIKTPVESEVISNAK